MQIIVCEDNRLYQKSICEKIRQWKDETQHHGIKITCFLSSEDFLEQWQKGIKMDIAFLDILFDHELNGMEVAQSIRKRDQNVPIVFITNSNAYIRDGYVVQAFRYLNKPVYYEDIAQCLEVAYERYTLAHNKYFILTNAGNRLAIRYEDILYIETRSPYSIVYHSNSREAIRLRCGIATLLPKLPNELFVMCHRSYIVNIMHMRCIRHRELVLSNQQLLPVSRSYAKEVNEAFDHYYQEGGVPFVVANI